MTIALPSGYNWPLVMLSVLIAMLAAYTTLDLAGRITAAKERTQLIWLGCGAIAMGTGIWSMHFIGMLALRLPLAVEYDVQIVLASVLPAVVASGLALFMVSRPTLGWRRLAGGSVLMGSGIATMHYVGMAAMNMSAVVHYNPYIVGLSWLIAIAVSWVGLFLAFQLREEGGDRQAWGKQAWKRLLAALLMGSAIPTMHYTGMAAADFSASKAIANTAALAALQPPTQFGPLAIAVAISTLTLFIIAWLSTFLDRRFAAQTTYAQALQKSQKQLQISEQKFKALAKQREVFNQLSAQIRQSLELDTILQTAVYEARQFFETDRALIYQFDENWQGSVTVEEHLKSWPTALGEAADNCFPADYLEQYRQGRIRKINNVLEAGLDAAHLSFLQGLKVQANLMVPIMVHDQLWGLLIVHQCAHPRIWQESEGDLLYRIATQLGIAIQQAKLYAHSEATAQQAQAQAQQLRASEGQLKQQTQALRQTLEEMQNLQMQLVQGEKMSSLGQLVAGVAHEINNPVNFIHGNLKHIQSYTEDLIELMSLYQQHYPNPEASFQQKIEEIDPEFLQQDLQKILVSMRVGTDRIREIVLSLRNFSRTDETDLKAVNIHEGIDSTLLILQHRLKDSPNAPAIKVSREYDSLPLVNCYPGQLNQVVMNVLANAIDALESVNAMRSREENKQHPGEIIIRTGLVGTDWVEIAIADNGPGMPEAVQSQIFNPFFTTKPVGKGTGMGMSISYKIVVEKHGGKLECFSSIEQGTEFFIRIPLRGQADTKKTSLRTPV